MIHPLLAILLTSAIALAALGIVALAIAMPGIARWARHPAGPAPVHVTVPVTLPGPGGGEPAMTGAALVPSAVPACCAERLVPRASGPAIDVRLEPCDEPLGPGSSSSAVRSVHLVIENIGDAPAFGLRLEPLAGESAMCFEGLACRGVLEREIPALGPGRVLRFKAGQRDAVFAALGGEALPVRPRLAARFAAAFAAEGDESVTNATIGVCTHGLEACAVSANHAASKPSARSLLKPLGKG